MLNGAFQPASLALLIQNFTALNGAFQPAALESRTVTRFDVHKYARAAYDLGVRYIGGCCGFEPYHVRAIAEELAEERGKLPASSAKHEPWGAGIWNSKYQFISAR